MVMSGWFWRQSWSCFLQTAKEQCVQVSPWCHLVLGGCMCLLHFSATSHQETLRPSGRRRRMRISLEKVDQGHHGSPEVSQYIQKRSRHRRVLPTSVKAKQKKHRLLWTLPVKKRDTKCSGKPVCKRIHAQLSEDVLVFLQCETLCQVTNGNTDVTS